MSAIVQFEGRQIPMDDILAGDDNLLKQALIPHLGPEIANATIHREQKDEHMVVTLVKRAGTKGQGHQALLALISAPEEINPVLGLAWMIRWNEARGTMTLSSLLELQPAIESSLEKGTREENHTDTASMLLKKAPAVASRQIVVGF